MYMLRHPQALKSVISIMLCIYKMCRNICRERKSLEARVISKPLRGEADGKVLRVSLSREI